MSTLTLTEQPLSLEAGTDRVMNYIECDLAADVTLPQWRRARAAASPRRRHILSTFAAPVRRAGAHAA